MLRQKKDYEPIDHYLIIPVNYPLTLGIIQYWLDYTVVHFHIHSVPLFVIKVHCQQFKLKAMFLYYWLKV